MPDHSEGFRPPTDPRTRRLGAREAIVCVLVAIAVLLVFEGPSIRESGEEMEPGLLRTVVLAVGHPAGWVGDQLPLAEAADEATSALSPDEDLGAGGFSGAAQRREAVPGVGPEAFDPRDLGAQAPEPRALRKLLVTGDSMAMPLDAVLARRLSGGDAVQVLRDPHLGTGISNTSTLDWGKLSARHAERDRPDAVVFFLGANEGFPMTGADGVALRCCDAAWAAEYAFRARQMMNTYRRGGEARVYWLTLPAPRDGDLAEVARTVNAAIRVAAQPYRAHVRVIDLATLFTPGGRFRDSMEVDGGQRLVRDADGIHLNDAGAELAADRVLDAVGADFSLGDAAR